MKGEMWAVAYGSDLAELVDSGQSLSSLLPSDPGIYLWKIDLRASVAQHAEAQSMTVWLDRLCRLPLGRTRAVRVSHFLSLGGLELRGSGLTPEKRASFARFLAKPPNRRWMLRYLEGLTQHMPALYVGEADDLSKRIKEHVIGSSTFGKQILEDGDLDWSDLRLYYIPLPAGGDEVVAARRSLEYLTTSLTVAGFTKRPG